MKTTLEIKNTESTDGYEVLLRAIKEKFNYIIFNNHWLFRVETTRLYDLFLSKLPGNKQNYNCNTCRKFFRIYGGLVIVKDDGSLESAVFPYQVPEFFEESIIAVKKKVENSKIKNVFFDKKSTLGVFQSGGFKHISVNLDKKYTRNISLRNNKSITEVIAEKRQSKILLAKTLDKYNRNIINQAVSILESGILYRGGAILSQARYIQNVYELCQDTFGRQRDNLIWSEAVQSPEGFCHVSSGMLGVLLDDIKNELPINLIKRKFDKKMSPDSYRRMKSLPTDGNIKQAEKLVDELGLANSLKRRYASIDEVPTIWKPTPNRQPGITQDGVFSRLKSKNKSYDIKSSFSTPQKMTWVKFRDKILPTAKSMKVLVNEKDHFFALLTCVDMDAPPILKWDKITDRYPFSRYTYNSPSFSEQWNLKSGRFYPVYGIYQKHGLFVLLLKGAFDLNHDKCGLGLFPEILRPELHSIRKTIEAYSETGVLGTVDIPACGIGRTYDGGDTSGITVKIFDGHNEWVYIIDRFD